MEEASCTRAIPDNILSALRRWFERTGHFDRELIFAGAKALLGREPDADEVKELEAFAENQLRFMADFRAELEANPPAIINTGSRLELIRPGKPPMSPAQVGARMELYADATHQAAQQVQRRSKARAGTTRWERLVMGEPKTEHCSECPPDADLGWVPFGTLRPIGDRECQKLCLCHFEYSDSIEKPGTIDQEPTQPEPIKIKEPGKFEQAISKFLTPEEVQQVMGSLKFHATVVVGGGG
jgi:hypothetical protein